MELISAIVGWIVIVALLGLAVMGLCVLLLWAVLRYHRADDPCDRCHGTGECPDCDGVGGFAIAECTTCEGSGLCMCRDASTRNT